MFRGGPMHTASSAKRTWRLPASASEYTATVFSPSSLHAHMTRSAISPRLAIRTFLNIAAARGLLAGSGRPDGEERVPVLDRLTVLGVDLDDLARHLGLDLVHELHGLDDAEHLPHLHPVAHVHEGRAVRVGCAVEGPDDWALDHRAVRGGFRRGRHRGAQGRGQGRRDD